MNGDVGRLDGVGVGLTNMNGELGEEMGEAEKERGLLTKMNGFELGLELAPNVDSVMAGAKGEWIRRPELLRLLKAFLIRLLEVQSNPETLERRELMKCELTSKKERERKHIQSDPRRNLLFTILTVLGGLQSIVVED